MTKNRTPTPVHLDPGMHPGLEVKGLIYCEWILNGGWEAITNGGRKQRRIGTKGWMLPLNRYTSMDNAQRVDGD